ncbi:MAG: hypothetical protein KJN96_06900 [Eudoraea sp.]|nr:hypothetical protein [Eudoraea sp.]
MKLKTTLLVIMFCGALALSCKDSAKEQEAIDRQIEEIESVEQAIDSTAEEVHKKAEEVNDLIKELDSI